MSDSDKDKLNKDELKNDLESLIRDKYGSAVKFAYDIKNSKPNDKNSDDEKKKLDLEFNLKPKELKSYLDRFVVKQDDAKKALSIAVCDHYNHVRQCDNNPSFDENYNYSKQNVLVLGPTGVGKTYLIKMIAKLIGVPFVKADATRFTETGYVGSNVEDLIHDLVAQANGDISLAEYGIIYLDEADKIAAPTDSNGRDISGKGVQFGLLKLMEETEIDLKSGMDMRSQLKSFMDFQQNGDFDKQIINTKHILFIISGAFTGLEDIIKRRLNKRQIGLGTQASNVENSVWLKHAVTKDFIDYGYEPEFIGRIPIRVSCEHLTKDDLFQILKNSEGSIIQQYIHAFDAYDIKVSFTDDALEEIAILSTSEKTGARGLITICEKALRNYKYELPSSDITELLITKEIILDPETCLKKILENTGVSINKNVLAQVSDFSSDFYHKFKLKISFDKKALREIQKQSNQSNIYLFCENLLKSFEHGLNLIKQNTGQEEFILPIEAVKDPESLLEKWIKKSYKNK
jgi:ATP-dependent Clp protease ATP-binding subunit ClpX